MNEKINVYDRQDAIVLAKKIGKKIRVIKSGVVYSSCPICDYNSKNFGKNDFLVRDDGRYHCNSCGADGMFSDLVRIVGVRDLPGYEPRSNVDDNSDAGYNELYLSEPAGGFRASDDLVKNLSQRGYTEDFVRRCQIHDYSNQSNCRFALPVRDVRRQLIGFVFGNEDYNWTPGFGPQRPYIVGMGDCRNRCGVLVITVGIDNYAAVMQAGIRHDCVCIHDYTVPGLNSVRNCMDFVSMYREIVIVSSTDPARIETCDALEYLLRGVGKRLLRTNTGDYNGVTDICKCKPDDIGCIIDRSGECVISGSFLVDGSSRVCDYVHSEKVPTDIEDLDRMMYGGLSFGAVHVVSGEAGQGKSTFCQRIVLSAITKGYRCWVYSAEKSAGEFSGDLERMAVRPGMAVKKTNIYGCDYYSISDDIRDDIKRWYRDNRIWYYDNMSDEDIIHNAEVNIKVNGVRVLIVDNLMTAMLRYKTVVGISVYDQQARFMAALVDLAEQYSVCIILVAHKNKRADDAASAGANNARISGASEIGNLAHTIITYDELNRNDVERIKKKIIEKKEKIIGRKLEKCEVPELLASVVWPDRLIRLTKNRNGGRRNIDGFWAYYNEETSRIYCNQDDLNVMYGWELPDYGGGRKTRTVYGDLNDVEATFVDTVAPPAKKDKPPKCKCTVSDYEYVGRFDESFGVDADDCYMDDESDEELPFV